MLLYGIYRNSKKAIADDQQKNLKSIVILSPLRTCEVYPVDAQPYADDGDDHVNNDAEDDEHGQTEDEHEKGVETRVHEELQAIECPV